MFFDGNSDAGDVQRWDYLLRRYVKRFCRWFPELVLRTGSFSGRSPPSGAFVGFWGVFKELWGPLAFATERLVHGFGVTAFGAYRCHAAPTG
jgi:hypothetical protein